MKKFLYLLMLVSFINLNYTSYADTQTQTNHPTIAQSVSVNPTPVTVQAQETVKALSEAELANLIHFEKTPMVLTSKLKKRYMAYKVTVKNDNHDPIILQGASLTNGYVGSLAADSVHTSKGWAFLSCIGGDRAPFLIPGGVRVLGSYHSPEGVAGTRRIPASGEIQRGGVA